MVGKRAGATKNHHSGQITRLYFSKSNRLAAVRLQVKATGQVCQNLRGAADGRRTLALTPVRDQTVSTHWMSTNRQSVTHTEFFNAGRFGETHEAIVFLLAAAGSTGCSRDRGGKAHIHKDRTHDRQPGISQKAGY